VLGKYAALLAFLLTIATPRPLCAEHEIYYRYVVLGYVKATTGKVLRGTRVELVREKTGFSYLGETDEAGLYLIVARLGDESLGEALRLQAGGHSVTVTVRFDAADHIHERGTRVDFVGDRPVEKSADFAPTLERYLTQ